MLRHYREGLWKGKWHPWWIFFREENQHVADAAIFNRKGSLKLSF
jgi:hypothetical protein